MIDTRQNISTDSWQTIKQEFGTDILQNILTDSTACWQLAWILPNDDDDLI